MSEQEAEKLPPQKDKGITEQDFYKPLYKKPVVLTLTDGKVYSGILAGVDRYHLILETKQGLTLFFKHAIKYVFAGKMGEGNP